MSAIVAAMHEVERVRAWYAAAGPASAIVAESIARNGRAIVAASNAAGAGRVVVGAPRTWARWWCDGDSLVAAAWGKTYRVGMPPRPGLRPCWDAPNRLWIWSTAAHDPRPCAWPRPFARGADR